MTYEYEKLGCFYLGEAWNATRRRRMSHPTLYDAKDLTTHAVCVGMTGSGKTGLGVALLEEAAIDGIPALVIDPKGDMGNLALTFPNLLPGDFEPWVDAAAATRQGLTPADYAAAIAQRWRKGLADWHQTPERIALLRSSAATVIYTPGSNAGRPISVLRSFDPPPSEELNDNTTLREQIHATVSGILGLLGITSDPLRDREHILLACILRHYWTRGQGLTLPDLIMAVQQPPFAQVGVFNVDAFYPAAERRSLAMSINNLLAAPGFEIWTQGDPLDIQRLLFDSDGRPKLAVMSIAHLNDTERMFFVTLLLNALISWMRRQSGTASLRALLYMDEIFGYFPPSAMPPSKTPMLTLLKQARAYGLGVVLSTQNPVDLDYKGLGNAGTWFIGRLQTERDKQRVLDGLEGAMAGGVGVFNRPDMNRIISDIDSRVFLMRNVHDDQPCIFHSRWVLSYLSGPMTLDQIRAVTNLSPPPRTQHQPQAPSSPAPATPVRIAVETASSKSVPPAGPPLVLPPDIPQYRLDVTRPQPAADGRVLLMGHVRLHFVTAGKDGFDYWENRWTLGEIPARSAKNPWKGAQTCTEIASNLRAAQLSVDDCASMPMTAGDPKNYVEWKKSLATHAYQEMPLQLYICRATRQVSTPGQSEAEFLSSVRHQFREMRDREVTKLRKSYTAKITTAENRLNSAAARLDREKSQLGQQKLRTVISFGTALLGAFMGRRAASIGTVGRTATTIRGVGRVNRERGDIQRAGENFEICRQNLDKITKQAEEAIAELHQRFDPANLEISTRTIRPRKSDITVEEIGLVRTAWPLKA